MHRNINIAIVGSGKPPIILGEAFLKHFQFDRSFHSHVYLHTPEDPLMGLEIIDTINFAKPRVFFPRTYSMLFQKQNEIDLVLLTSGLNQAQEKDLIKYLQPEGRKFPIPLGLVSMPNHLLLETRFIQQHPGIQRMSQEKYVFNVPFDISQNIPHVKVDMGRLSMNNNLKKQKKFFTKFNNPIFFPNIQRYQRNGDT